jgi:hypothetical protein
VRLRLSAVGRLAGADMLTIFSISTAAGPFRI